MGSGIRITKLWVVGDAVIHVVDPNEEVSFTFVADTVTISWGGPTDVDHIVKWSGDLGHNPKTNHDDYFQQYLWTNFAPGAHKVTASGSAGHKSLTVTIVVDTGTGTSPCNLTAISPATVTVFVSQPRTFTAEGTGLKNVQWSAPGGTPATGTGRTFTTKWLKTGQKTVTATCGGTTNGTDRIVTTKRLKTGQKTAPTKTAATVTVLDLEIQINNTSSANDDLVQVKWDHPPRRFKVPCQIRLSEPTTAPVTVDLGNPDQRLRFFDPADPTRADTLIKVELPANRAWKAFEITGEKPAKKKAAPRLRCTTRETLWPKNP